MHRPWREGDSLKPLEFSGSGSNFILFKTARSGLSRPLEFGSLVFSKTPDQSFDDSVPLGPEARSDKSAFQWRQVR